MNRALQPAFLRPIGKFQRTHALQGELNAYLEVEDDYLRNNPWITILMDGIPTPFRVENIRPKGANTSLVKLAGVDTEPTAKLFVNREILTESDTLAQWLNEDEDGMYASDFIGYRLLETAETPHEIGTISDVNLSSSENPLFVVQLGNNREVFIPVADELITEIDMKNKTITMTLPEGLLEI